MTKAIPRTAARAVADLAAGSILARVEIAAPPERVFRALTDPKEIVRWWGAEGHYRTTEWESDLRKGGRFRAGGKSQDGSSFAVVGEFLEIDPPHTLVHTWEPTWDQGAATTVSYRLEAIESGTRVTLRHEGFGTRRNSCEGHGAGWELVLGWLADHAAGTPAPEVLKYFLCRLHGPRPTFPMDMTAAEREVMLAHVQYLQGLMAKGAAVVFGPVADPAGVWGLGLLRVKDEAELAALTSNDPTVKSGLGFRYETFPMLNAIAVG